MEKSFDFGALLQNHEKKHKSKPMQFVSVAGGVKKRLENSLKNRKSTRFSVLDKIRNLSKSESPIPENKVQSKMEHRRMQLEKWKEEKEKKKKEASQHKKKPFIAGVPHNPLKFVPPPPAKLMPSTSGRVTRSQSSKNKTNNISKQKSVKPEPKENKKFQSFAPKYAKFNPILKDMSKFPTLSSPKNINKNEAHIEPLLNTDKGKTCKPIVAKRETRTSRYKQCLLAETNISNIKNNHKTKKSLVPLKSLSSTSNSSVESNSSGTSEERFVKTRTPRKSIAKEKVFTPENRKVPKSESSSEEKLRSPKELEMPMTPEQIVDEFKKISPCVTLSRGKDNARKEMKKKIDEGLLDDDICEMGSVENFRMQLDSEIKRMTEMCETWEKISEQVPLPDLVQESLLGAVGQARLLMSQKLQQFASLLRRCEQPEPGQALVTPGDLHGFWDMVFMQIENVDMRFKKLEEMRARGWVEEQPVVVKKKVPAKPVAIRKPAATSKLRDIIAAARKAKKDQPTDDVREFQKPDESKTFEAGFFSVRSPIKSPLGLSTPRKSTLLKAVLSSEANKSANKLYQSSASYAMLRASLIGKNVDNEISQALDVVSLTPINLSATPARSILKSTKKSGKKSIKVVLFDNSDIEVLSDAPSPKYDPEISGVEKFPTDSNADSGLSSMDIEKEQEGKENRSSRRKSKLIRQDATEERSPVMTRSRRKSVQTPASEIIEEKRSSRRKKTLQDVEVNVKDLQDTPKRSSRRQSSVLA